MSDECIFDVPVTTILQWANPLESPPWVGVVRPITRDEIEAAIASDDLISRPVGPGEFLIRARTAASLEENCESERRLHIARIAFLVLHPSDEPICIEFGCPVLGYTLSQPEIEDGHHRLAAAMIRGDETIRVSPSGSLEEAERVLMNEELPARLAF